MADETPTPQWQVLVLNGPCGVGKSVLADKMSAALSPLAHAVFDLDALGWVYPRAADDPYGTTFALHQLAALRPALEDRGITRAIVPYAVESPEEMAALSAAFGGAKITHVRLRAEVPVLAERLAGRERGSGLAWHTERAAILAYTLDGSLLPADLVLDTDGRSPESLAAQVLTQAPWPG